MEESKGVAHLNVILSIWHTYKIAILLVGVSLICISAGIFLLVTAAQSSQPIQFSSDSASVSVQLSPIVIDIAGAVRKPGVYTMPVGSRVEDVIVMAGGFSPEADEEKIYKTINRASKLKDGLKIYIPSKQDNTNNSSHNNNSQRETSSNMISGEGAIIGVAQGGMVSINFASQSELESLSGIGPVTANKIISNRPYSSLEDLVGKNVLGQSLFEKLKNSLSL